MVEVIISGSDGENEIPVKVDFLWDEDDRHRTYGLKVSDVEVRVNATELEDAMKFCQEHQGE